MSVGLDLVELVMEMERAFAIEIPDRDAERLRTVGEMYDYVRERVAAGPDVELPSSLPAGPYEGPLWERFLDVVEKELGTRRRDLLPHKSFIEDLGVD